MLTQGWSLSTQAIHAKTLRRLSEAQRCETKLFSCAQKLLKLYPEAASPGESNASNMGWGMSGPLSFFSTPPERTL